MPSSIAGIQRSGHSCHVRNGKNAPPFTRKTPPSTDGTTAEGAAADVNCSLVLAVLPSSDVASIDTVYGLPRPSPSRRTACAVAAVGTCCQSSGRMPVGPQLTVAVDGADVVHSSVAASRDDTSTSALENPNGTGGATVAVVHATGVVVSREDGASCASTYPMSATASSADPERKRRRALGSRISVSLVGGRNRAPFGARCARPWKQ